MDLYEPPLAYRVQCSTTMPVFEDLMKRMGFVKLRRFGLMLTDDGRVVSTRQRVLDDDGTPVVGWRDADLAATELPSWGTPKPPPAPIQPGSISVRMLAAKPPTIPPPIAPPVAPPSLVAAPPPAPVADDAEEPDEDWEWRIAIARARAAADEADAAAAKPAFIKPPETLPGKKDPNETQPGRKKTTTAAPQQPRRAERMASVKPNEPYKPSTTATDKARLALVKSAPGLTTPAVGKPVLAIVASSKTEVTPVPRTGKKTAPMTAVATPARSTTPMRAPTPDVVGKSTQRMETAEPDIIDEQPLSVGDQTQVGPAPVAAPVTARQRVARGTQDTTQTEAAPEGDHTDTKISLPPAPRPGGLPSITSRMARR